MEEVKQQLLVVVGPTAVGKTALGIELSKRFNGEIINGDSLQVYKSLNIGTAKPSTEEQKEAVHHLIDWKEMDEPYSVNDFVKDAKACVEEIHSRGKLPILVGGTGLYVQSLLEDYSLGGAKESETLREKYMDYLQEFGEESLWKELQRRDARASEKIPMGNSRRVIRALEVLDLTGESMFSEVNRRKSERYDAFIIGLNTERELLYDRINQRVEKMMEEGLEKEARLLYEKYPQAQSAQAIGYKEFFPYFQGKIKKEEAVELVTQHSRNYAKRQLTWFRNRMQTSWWDFILQKETKEKLIEEIKQWRKK